METTSSYYQSLSDPLPMTPIICATTYLRAIVPIGAIIMVSSVLSSAIAQPIPPIPDPLPVSETLPNLVTQYDVSLDDEDGLFDASAPLSRRDYIIHTVAAFDALSEQIRSQAEQEQEAIRTSCFVRELVLHYLTGRVDRLQNDMNRLRSSATPSLASNGKVLSAIAAIPLLESSIKIRTTTPSLKTLMAQAAAERSYVQALWFYNFDETLIDTLIPGHQQPLTHGDFVGYLSPTLDELDAYVFAQRTFQRAAEELELVDARLNGIFDQVASVRLQLARVQRSHSPTSKLWPKQMPILSRSNSKQVLSLTGQHDSDLTPAPWSQAIETVPDMSPADPAYDALWRAHHVYGVFVLQSDGYFYPDEVLTLGDFARYHHQWTRRILELVQHGAPIDYLPILCGNEFSAAFYQETENMEHELQLMELELQSLMGSD